MVDGLGARVVGGLGAGGGGGFITMIVGVMLTLTDGVTMIMDVFVLRTSSTAAAVAEDDIG